MKRSTDCSGYILVTVAVLLVVLLAVTSLAIDIGLSYGARTQSQAAADAAALAGAFTFLDSTAAQPATAEAQAVKGAVANKTMGGAISAGDVSAVANVGAKRITVDITRTEPTFFSKIIGFNSVQVHTQAVAEAGANASQASCAKPIFIPNTLGTTQPCGGPCTNGNSLLDSNGNKTAYATSVINAGTVFLMKPSDPGDAIAPSDFYVINPGGGGGGANEVGDAIGSCIPDMTVLCNSTQEVKTGNMVNQVKDGFNDLMGYPDIDTYDGVRRYLHPADNLIYDTSKSLITVPIVDLCSYPGFCPANHLPSGGNVNLTVKGFALLFVDHVGQTASTKGDVYGRLQDVFGCGMGGTSSGSAVFGVPIRLVRLP